MRLWSVWIYTCGEMKLDLGVKKKGFSWEKDFIFAWRKLEKLNLKVWIEWRILNYCLSAANTLFLMLLIFKARALTPISMLVSAPLFLLLSLAVYILRHARAPASDPLSFSYPTSVLHICMCSISVPLPVSTSFTQPAIRFPRMGLILFQVLLEPTAFSHCGLEWPSLEHRVSFQGKFCK